MADSDDGAFLRELLALLDDTDAAAPPLDDLLKLDDHIVVVDAVVPAPALPPLRPALPKGGAARLKRTVDDMRAEASALTEQLERMRAAHGAAIKERALAERHKRQRAEDDCCKLREAVYEQRRFIRGMRSVFSGIPRFALGLDLCRYLHRHTRLARNRNLRWGEFDVGAHNERMRSAMDILCHETESLSLSDTPQDLGDQTQLSGHTPFINGETVDTGDCYTTTSMAVYAVDAMDLSAVVRATCVAVRDVATICGSGHPLQVSRDIIDVDASPASNILYRVLAVRHLCASLREELTFETHLMTSYKITDDYAIVLWDFVDVDELHPTPDTTNIAREVTGACLIRREWCSDGVERTVFRSLATKKFRFLSQESARRLRRFSCITHPTALVRGNEMLFRQIVLDQLATERAIYSGIHPITTRS